MCAQYLVVFDHCSPTKYEVGKLADHAGRIMQIARRGITEFGQRSTEYGNGAGTLSQ